MTSARTRARCPPISARSPAPWCNDGGARGKRAARRPPREPHGPIERHPRSGTVPEILVHAAERERRRTCSTTWTAASGLRRCPSSTLCGIESARPSSESQYGNAAILADVAGVDRFVWHLTRAAWPRMAVLPYSRPERRPCGSTDCPSSGRC